MAPMLNDTSGEHLSTTPATMDSQSQHEECGTKGSAEESSGDKSPMKRLHEDESNDEGDDAETSHSNGLLESESPQKRPRGRPRRDSPYVKPPKDDTPKKRGRPRIHPPKDPNAEKRPRGRPPTTAKALAKKELAAKIAEGAKNMTFEEMQNFTITSQKKMLDMKKKMKDLEDMLEDRDEQIFMLRSKLQEMGVDTDSLSMSGNNNHHLMYMGQEEMMPTLQERPIDVIVIRPETDSAHISD